MESFSCQRQYKIDRVPNHKQTNELAYRWRFTFRNCFSSALHITHPAKLAAFIKDKHPWITVWDKTNLLNCQRFSRPKISANRSTLEVFTFRCISLELIFYEKGVN